MDLKDLLLRVKDLGPPEGEYQMASGTTQRAPGLPREVHLMELKELLLRVEDLGLSEEETKLTTATNEGDLVKAQVPVDESRDSLLRRLVVDNLTDLMEEEELETNLCETEEVFLEREMDNFNTRETNNREREVREPEHTEDKQPDFESSDSNPGCSDGPKGEGVCLKRRAVGGGWEFYMYR